MIVISLTTLSYYSKSLNSRPDPDFPDFVSHEKLIEDNKADYYLTLRKSQKTIKTKKEDINPWLRFFLGIILEQSEIAVDLLSEENIEKLFTEKQLKVWQYLENTGSATPLEIAKKTKVAQPTVRQALDKLMRLKKIERIGQGRGTSYRKMLPDSDTWHAYNRVLSHCHIHAQTPCVFHQCLRGFR